MMIDISKIDLIIPSPTCRHFKGLSRSPLKLFPKKLKKLPKAPPTKPRQHNMGPSKKGNDATRAELKAKKRKLEDAIPDLPGDEVAEEKPEKKRKRSGDEDAVEEKEKKKKRKKDKDVGEDEDNETRRAAKKARKALKTEQNGNAAVEEPGAEEEALKKSKKERKALKAEQNGNETAQLAVQEPVAEEEVPKKSKKERKAERKAKEAAEAAAANGTVAKDSMTKVEANGDGEGKKSKKNNRNRSEKPKRDATAKESGEEGGKAARFICFIGKFPQSFLIVRSGQLII
jgi:nucleolar protein 6